MVGLLLISLILKTTPHPTTILLFIIFSFIPDIDGLLALLIERNNKIEARDIINSIKQMDFVKAATHASVHHKKFNKLLIHNFVGFFVILTFFTLGLKNYNYYSIYIFGAFLSHFVFDIADDIYQLGNINNWLWPYSYLFKRERQ